ncbi:MULTISPECIES: mannosyl-3-phosphoglycerate phosphatase [Thalassospira]|jgi:mannosyl-3-phosphoglycerate phosphatase|uniref:Mannosyl-3-phosphoglycerate phosphatase n=1 Tax=Thalassospira profundimaris TaxID=502049 RepID=A0A367V3N0_9PROT|nr:MULTISPECIES: HAD-IIB family hydrolase [Thalassospira]KZB72662.1 mannosyl-3-phosphoglycerate phosphatase [Thalassospira sp. MCCC 1A01148]MBS8273086.1 HAD-IIB family hydrolase [Thalassospira tepidiphila]RCK19649.1 mannosyl-3-phosphoglycerate phosphatase [Thalassospira profundimaris]HAI31521.1 HAD-IIB family hydrolase [Thalassospira sp.]|tara:strand:+ start:2539 stop:3375 length:837 start_codon:yes stop_codon:yes gene_type:complete
MPQSRAIAIFTDLDGTLLDHDTYSWSDARPALDRLKQLSIPLIAVSSKTLAELEHINKTSCLFDGLIGENGGVIALNGNVEQYGPATETVDHTREAIRTAVTVPLDSFRTVSPEIIATETGLPLEDAIRAGQRHCSDPLIWQPAAKDIALAREIAEKADLRLVKGGRFHTLCGPSSKGQAMRRMVERLTVTWLEDASRQRFTTIALGDSPNDIPMLAEADYAVQIPSKHGKHTLPLLEHPNLRIAPQPGPAGWNEAVNEILDQITDTNTNKNSEVLHG